MLGHKESTEGQKIRGVKGQQVSGQELGVEFSGRTPLYKIKRMETRRNSLSSR